MTEKNVISSDWPGLAWIGLDFTAVTENSGIRKMCVYMFDVDFIQKERFHKTFRDQKDYILTENKLESREYLLYQYYVSYVLCNLQ